MKTLLLVTSFLVLLGVKSIAQSSVTVNDFTNGQAAVQNNGYIFLTSTSGEHLTTEINVTNTSNTTKVYKLKRYDDVLNTGASAYFCVGGGNCYPPSVTLAPLSVTLTANGTPNDNLHTQNLKYLLDLEEAVTPGISHIRYEIFDQNNPSDVFTFTIYYNDVLSVKNNTQALSFVSSVYPNPAVNKAFVNITSQELIDNASITITNSLGTIVSSKYIDLGIGKNTISIDSENLSSGIYFATICSSRQNKIIKKFTVNK